MIGYNPQGEAPVKGLTCGRQPVTSWYSHGLVARAEELALRARNARCALVADRVRTSALSRILADAAREDVRWARRLRTLTRPVRSDLPLSMRTARRFERYLETLPFNDRY